jgi:YidC/Oxa1 family membrane protein insertase|tara:strand:- start:1310 stop:3133 length:1824 start_codon:yes stop_codon:yes gene_type:complete
MKQYDKNSLIGLLLMGFILIIFNTYFFPQVEVAKTEKKDTTGIVTTTVNEVQIEQSKTEIIADAIVDSLFNQQFVNQYGVFANTAIGTEKESVLENEKLKITFSNKGGRITSVILKEFQTHDSLPLQLFDADSSRFNLQFSVGKPINAENLFFVAKQNGNALSMKLMADANHYVEYIYTITDDYLIDFDIHLVGMENLIPSGVNYMNLEWQMKTPQTEKSKSNQDMYTGIQYQYSADKEVDYLSFTSDDEEKINARLNWVAFKQQFFSAIIIAKDGFEKPTHLESEKNENSKYIKNLSAQFELPYQHKNNEQLNFQFYFGPNHYKTLKSYNAGFEKLIPLGWGLFGWVNQYIIINLFDFLSKYMSNYGLIILLLTIIIKLALSPFTYKAYLSQAKMKVLKPEIDKITEKHKKKDPMKSQQETMALYRKAGVNPMGGCLPMLFQFPILIAMFRFFPASIELRQKSFLWADDLSSYDSIMSLPWDIPFYGDHVSLFTLLMTVSTIMYTRMNSQSMGGQMEQMKWIMYLMPIMFLGFFNNYAAALSYYYFLANIFTFSQQYFMKRFIDEDAILAQLEANKKKPAKPKSKFQKKLEDMQRKQEQQMKKRGK